MSSKPKWMQDAEEKKLPQQFIDSMEESDSLTDGEKAKVVASLDTAAELERKRAAAVELGRRLGEQTADELREAGVDRLQRIARAKAYAAWVFDGKPISSERQREEFGVETIGLGGYLERPKPWQEKP